MRKVFVNDGVEGRRLGVGSNVAEVVASAEALSVLGVRLPGLAVCLREGRRDINVLHVASLRIHEPQIAHRAWIAIQRRHVHDEMSPMEASILSPARIHSDRGVGDHNREALLARAFRKLHERVAEARGALRFHRLQHFEDAEDAALPSPRLHFRADDLVEWKNRDAVEMREADVTERRGDASGLVELGRLAHRLARVDKEVDR